MSTRACFGVEQLALAFQSPAIAAQAFIFTNHAMTRDDERRVITRAGAGNGPYCFRFADSIRDLLIRASYPERNSPQFIPYAPLKCSRLNVERQVDARGLAVEMLKHLVQPEIQRRADCSVLRIDRCIRIFSKQPFGKFVVGITERD